MKTFSAVSTVNGWIYRWVLACDTEDENGGGKQIPHIRVVSGVPIEIAVHDKYAFVCALIIQDVSSGEDLRWPLGFHLVSSGS